jgi:hypothetical protein
MKLIAALPLVFAATLASDMFAAETQPAPTTPRETLLAILTAAKTGDLDATLKYFSSETEKEKLAAEALMLEVMPWAAIEHAAVAKFGKEGIMDKFDGPQLEKEIDKVKNGVEKIEGNKASFYLAHDGKAPDPLPEKPDLELKKVGGEWKFNAEELGSYGSKPERLERARAIYKAAKEVAADIKAGKFSTADEASRAATAKFKEVEAKYKPKDEMMPEGPVKPEEPK